MICCTKWDHHTKILIKHVDKEKCYIKKFAIFSKCPLTLYSLIFNLGIGLNGRKLELL